MNHLPGGRLFAKDHELRNDESKPLVNSISFVWLFSKGSATAMTVDAERSDSPELALRAVYCQVTAELGTKFRLETPTVAFFGAISIWFA